MSLMLWIVQFICQSIIYKWILSWDGAQWIEGWKSGLTLGWFTWDWNAEQIRFYILMIWIFSCIWFVCGVLIPELRL